jgi:hypothetical protein
MPSPLAFTLHPYHPSDREGVRRVTGFDEFARPELARVIRAWPDYLADGMSHYV